MAPAIARAVLSGLLAADPLPAGTSFDGISYSFATGGALGPRGSLHAGASGAATYPHATEPHTGSGGVVTNKTCAVPKEEAASALTRLWPLLEKADPGFWKPRPIPDAPAALGGAVLAGALGIQPLPGTRAPIDSLSYTFGTAGADGAGGRLHIANDGKVSYSHSTAPFTGSGGRVTKKSWELAPAERDELFARLVADGLLEGGEHGLMWGDLQVTSGRWRASLKAQKVPATAMRHLRPLLEKAHPALWAEKEPAPDPRKPAPKGAKPVPPVGALWQFNYYFAPKAEGDHVLLYLGRGGEVSYQRYAQTSPGATKTHVQTTWTIPAKEAEALLSALAAGGVCDLEVVPRDTFPVHRVEVGTGPWWSTFYTKPLPDRFKALLLPLLRKADPEFWK